MNGDPAQLKKGEADLQIDSVLRPEQWDEYIGQERIKANVKIMIEAAQKRGERPDHMLFYGPQGLGKTTIANLIAREMGAQMRVTSGVNLEKTGDLVSTLANLEEGDILFVDEAHRINRTIEEILYPAMESRKLHMTIGKGPAARQLTLDLPAFTLIAATTRVNLLSAPLRSRFGAIFSMDYYAQEHIEEIIRRSARILGLTIEPAAVTAIARAARFTPRTANRLLKRVRDYAQVKEMAVITEEAVLDTLELLEIDELGLEKWDRKLLESIIKKFNGGPVGLNTLVAILGEDKGTVEEVYEPFLIKMGLLQKTSSGRAVTEEAYAHLNLKQFKVQ
ncbi:MAG: Holliday junction ATP-dependent DNA helicase RuvB [Candidatus Wolfebacteria bacterium GW2011_GWC2_39_22]|uniref:Holliday junction branch migration complex subunit RuvB n=2 Tax=Candidatus Wolfeibacteriota TaxID=1752735 RepID=A0A0G1JGY5_9BACT|nr:MAG: Holliday junction ATP-dependent DNA helicase RuvB [Candidatus Wolfebacteria bacterium GW2011_GWC2_39_22]KKT43272.1 MAG: Holliday junction ATP-dependent DNA helicase RuvB [Candidatus Wolfebacteria bacterium GW2011_GWE2_44_13]HBI25990.1 Holliday junction branch migration DNA helicase RuvB [Candidatus Wolfebacteria bacterium]